MAASGLRDKIASCFLLTTAAGRVLAWMPTPIRSSLSTTSSMPEVAILLRMCPKVLVPTKSLNVFSRAAYLPSTSADIAAAYEASDASLVGSVGNLFPLKLA